MTSQDRNTASDNRRPMQAKESSPPFSHGAFVGEERPWGNFLVLRDEPHYKLKQLQVKPGHRLSLQLHHHREEHWVVTKGCPEITLGDQAKTYSVGAYIHIPTETKHRIANPGPDMVEIIEIQQGTYFGEDDIVRFEDDYNRCS